MVDIQRIDNSIYHRRGRADGASLSTALDTQWVAKCLGVDEIGVWNGKTIVQVDPRYFRPSEVETLLGDASKAREKLGWKTEYSLEDIVNEMMESDLNLMMKELYF